MSTQSHFLLGTTLVVIAATITEFMPAGRLVGMLMTAVLAILVAFRGRRLSLTLRVVATGCTLHYAFQMCLVGRTMAPFLSAYTIQMSLMHFAIFAALPTIALMRAWQGRTRVLVCSLMLPMAFVCACSVAAFEESRFIAQHNRGVGPTPRWTVSHHWLSYNPSTGLQGSD